MDHMITYQVNIVNVWMEGLIKSTFLIQEVHPTIIDQLYPKMGWLHNKSNQLWLQLLCVVGNTIAITITVFIKSNQLKCDNILM